MAKKAKRKKPAKGLSKRGRLIVLPVMGIIGVGAIILAVMTIIVMPKAHNASQYGVGANGFRAYVEDGTSLGIANVISKDQVVQDLGDKAKSVSDVSSSKVMNLNGDRGQTATFDFIRKDGVKSSLYADMMLFKNTASLESARITAGTGTAGTINGFPAYYMHAQTLGSDREYRLMVVNGLKVYKFVIVQPFRNITISEVSAVASLKKLATKANL